VLPFLTALAHLATDAPDTTIVLKLHTKRSRHRSDGDSWRRDMVNRLVEGRNFRRILARFANDPSVGLVGPAGHFLSMSAYWGANEARVQALARRMGVATVRQEHEGFFAGSMFFARLAALRPVIALALAPDDFEEESAQVDGTLAHAVERLFSIACTHAGMRQLDTDEVLHPERPTLPIEDYRHAPPPPPPDLRKQAGPPALAPTVGIG
jgi:lipopolysaccharide biosynthesis protein